MVVLGLLLWGWMDVRQRAEINSANPVSHRTDFTVYTEAGAAFFDGRDPYSVTNIRGWHYLYPPLFAILVAPLHTLPTAWQGFIWFLLSLLMAGGCLFECRTIIRKLLDAGGETEQEWYEHQRWIILWAALALLFPVLDTLQRGQVGLVVLWPLLMGFRFTLDTQGMIRPFCGGILLAFPVALKVTPALPVCILLVRFLSDAYQQGWSLLPWKRFTHTAAGVAMGVVLFFILVPTMTIGWKDNLRHLETWYERVATNEQVGLAQQFNVHSVRNQGLANAVYRLGNWLEFKVADGPDDRIADNLARTKEKLPMDTAVVDHLITGLRAFLVVLLLLVAVRWRWETDPLGQAAVFGLACAMTLPLSPISWGHHFVLLLPGALFLPLTLYVQGRSLAARALAISAAALLLMHYSALELAGGIAGRLGVLGIGMTVWCAAVSTLLLYRPSNVVQHSVHLPRES
jgi:hypothetical protein